MPGALNSKEIHEGGMKDAEERREEIADVTREKIKSHNALDEKEAKAQKKHVTILEKKQEAAEKDSEIHERGIKTAEERREDIAEATLEELNSHYALDEKEAKARKKHDKILEEKQEAAEKDSEVHERGTKTADERREDIAEATREEIKSRNALDEKEANAQKKHVTILNKKQEAAEKDSEIHERGIKTADERRQDIAEATLEEFKYHNALDEKEAKTRKKHDKILEEKQEAAEKDSEVHERGTKTADERREDIAKATREEIKSHNALDEKEANAQKKHVTILEKKQEAAEKDSEIHERRIKTADERREDIAEATLEELKSHNALDEKEAKAQKKHYEILDKLQKAAEGDSKAHESGFEKAEKRRKEMGNANLEAIKEKNALGEKEARAQTKHDRTLIERQKAAEGDMKAHDNGLEGAEKRRGEVFNTNFAAIKEKNAIQERGAQARRKHDEMILEHQQKVEVDFKGHESDRETAETRRQEIFEANLEAIKEKNAMDERISKAQEKHLSNLNEHQSAAERDVKAHDRGLETGEERREEIAKSTLEEIKAHNGLEEKIFKAQKKHTEVLSEKQKLAERDLETHNCRLEAARERREEITKARVEEIKAHNAIDEKISKAHHKHDKIFTEKQIKAERDVNAHQCSLKAAKSSVKNL